jgi:hypothetical protein
MKSTSILAIAIAAPLLAACAGGPGGSGGSGLPGSGIFSPSSGGDADLRARYQQYRQSGRPPYLDFESWKRMHGTPKDYTGSGS